MKHYGIRRREQVDFRDAREDLNKQQQAIIEANKESFSEMQSDLMGLSNGRRQLSLYKDWHLVSLLNLPKFVLS